MYLASNNFVSLLLISPFYLNKKISEDIAITATVKCIAIKLAAMKLYTGMVDPTSGQLLGKFIGHLQKVGSIVTSILP